MRLLSPPGTRVRQSANSVELCMDLKLQTTTTTSRSLHALQKLKLTKDNIVIFFDDTC